MHSKCIVASHRKDVECEAGNLQLAKSLHQYNFTNFILEKSSISCQNDRCNKSYVLILNHAECDRFMETVLLQEQPTVLSHHSLRELVYMNHKMRNTPISVEKKSTQVQATVEVCSRSTEIPFQTRSFQVQTEETRIEAPQTRSMCSQTVEPPVEVHHQVVVPSAPTHSVVVPNAIARQENYENDNDDEIVFIQNVQSTKRVPSITRKRQHHHDIFKNNNLKVSVEFVKEEVEENDSPPKESDNLRRHYPEPINEKEIKEEPPAEEQQEIRSLANVSEKLNDSNVSTGCVPISTDSDCSFASAPEAKRSRKSASWFSTSFCEKCLVLMPTDDSDEVFKHILENHFSINRYHCKMCRKSFSHFETAQEHMKEHGCDSENRKEISFPCVLCDSKEPSAVNFGKHDQHSKNFIVDYVNPVYLSKLHEICVASFPDVFMSARKADFSKVKFGLTAEAMRTSFPQV